MARRYSPYNQPRRRLLKTQNPEIQMEEKETRSEETAIPPLTFDAQEYWHFVEDYDMTDKAKHKLLEAIWSIVVEFVDIGFGVHPIQQACGKLDGRSSNAAILEPGMVDSLGNLIDDESKDKAEQETALAVQGVEK